MFESSIVKFELISLKTIKTQIRIQSLVAFYHHVFSHTFNTLLKKFRIVYIFKTLFRTQPNFESTQCYLRAKLLIIVII